MASDHGRSLQVGNAMVFGVSVGLIFGVALRGGAAIAVGIVFGAGVGVVLGAAASARRPLAPR